MQQIRNGEKLDTITFWGRVTGDTADYLVVCGILSGGDQFPVKKFYYTTTRQPEKLSQMPDYDENAPLTYAPFTGEPSALAEDLREEHRLARHVAAIDFDASVVPLGAYTVDSSHRVVKNVNFQGLTYEAAGSLKNFYHFRRPLTEAAQSALQKVGLVRASDFLDPIHQFVSLNYAPDKTHVVMKHFYWPGATFTYHIDTGRYSTVYEGDGIPNQDLPFML